MFGKILTTSILIALAVAAPSTEEGKSSKRRQYIAPLAGAAQVPRNPLLFAAPALPVAAAPALVRPAFAPVAVAAAPAIPVAAGPVLQQPAVVAPVVAPVGQCPGGPSLPIECDPKRPWPQCPPQSYCYATNSVDIGPYFCCPVWSTYGAAWRPATPFYNYVPPVPANWPDVARMTANWPAAAVAMPLKARKQQKNEGDDETEDEQKIGSAIDGWVERQAKLVSSLLKSPLKLISLFQ
uniref:Secreted protein n=2 Tax=Caenorhabditis tropicalis TaxID=1561998 RepID=A0A1I7TSN2_9PELO